MCFQQRPVPDSANLDSSEIKRPISFDFPSNVGLVRSTATPSSDEIELIEVKPEGSRAPVVRWKFESLQPGEYFKVQFVAKGELKALPEVSARILGCSMKVAKKDRSVSQSLGTSTLRGGVSAPSFSPLRLVRATVGVLAGAMLVVIGFVIINLTHGLNSSILVL